MDESNRENQEWRNTVMFFWRAEEPFSKKSLPQFFEELPVRYFLFEQNNPDLQLTSMKAMPWFNQPGGGTKYVCKLNDKELTVPELHNLGVINYYQAVELNENLEILNDRENYIFLINESITKFEHGHFYLQKKRVPLHIVYSIGAVHIVKKVGI